MKRLFFLLLPMMALGCSVYAVEVSDADVQEIKKSIVKIERLLQRVVQAGDEQYLDEQYLNEIWTDLSVHQATLIDLKDRIRQDHEGIQKETGQSRL